MKLVALWLWILPSSYSRANMSSFCRVVAIAVLLVTGTLAVQEFPDCTKAPVGRPKRSPALSPGGQVTSA